MFLGFLNDLQRLTLLGLARQMVTQNTNLHPSEVGRLERMQEEMGICEETKVPIPAFEELPEIYTDRKSQSIVLIELMGTAFVDSRFDCREDKFIVDVARSFNVSDEQLKAMQDWIRRLRTLLDEAIDLWS
jgi:uncharacterized tellurite resistance protein B-like protein